jgi:hypothetical protein
MSAVVSRVLGTVNAPYGANVSARQLASSIADLEVMKKAMGPTFAFFTEVAPDLQTAFIVEMGVDPMRARIVAKRLAAKCPYPIALAA